MIILKLNKANENPVPYLRGGHEGTPSTRHLKGRNNAKRERGIKKALEFRTFRQPTDHAILFLSNFKPFSNCDVNIIMFMSLLCQMIFLFSFLKPSWNYSYHVYSVRILLSSNTEMISTKLTSEIRTFRITAKNGMYNLFLEDDWKEKEDWEAQ